jgi:hypothetical protein
MDPARGLRIFQVGIIKARQRSRSATFKNTGPRIPRAGLVFSGGRLLDVSIEVGVGIGPIA